MNEDTLKVAIALLKDHDRLSVKRYEMSEATFRQIELQMRDHLVPLEPNERRTNSLWGISIYFDNTIPLGEIKPVYA